MPEQQSGARVSENLFRVLGQQPLLGRDFRPDDGKANSERVAILGNTLWKNRYGGDANVLGKAIRINGEPAVIVGVMPPGVKFPTRAEIWTQTIPNSENAKRSRREYLGVGRVKPGVSRADAQRELTAMAARMATDHPDTNKDMTAGLLTFNERFNGGPIRIIFLALQGAVGFVLLIACANVANLQLSRAIHRAREMAVRTALGATRWRVIRQLLVESVMLGCVGGALGLLIALVGVRMFDAAVADVGKPYWIVFSMDYAVFGFLAAICVVTGILFGIAPALADLEDERQRPAQGRRTRQRRQPPHALAHQHHGGRRARVDARAARRCRAHGAQLPEALHRRPRHTDRPPDDDEDVSCRTRSIRSSETAPRVLTTS